MGKTIFIAEFTFDAPNLVTAEVKKETDKTVTIDLDLIYLYNLVAYH